jgi:adenylate cyclase
MRLFGRPQSRFNPRFCAPCERFEHPGGAEVVITMFFADVRGSTALAETMSALEFGQLMNRFYKVASEVLILSDALVDRLIGDEAIGLYIPGFAGPQHPRRAIEAAQKLLALTGHSDPGGPSLPVGVGIHTGPAFVGVVGGTQGALMDFTALGDNVNITARLASEAGPGEILVSEVAYQASGIEPESPEGAAERRQLELKGKSGSTSVRVLRIRAGK